MVQSAGDGGGSRQRLGHKARFFLEVWRRRMRIFCVAAMR